MDEKQIGETYLGPLVLTTKYACTLCGEQPQPTVNITLDDCSVSLCLTCLQWFVAKLQAFSRELFEDTVRKVHERRNRESRKLSDSK